MTWYDVCGRGEVPSQRGWPVTVHGQPIAVFSDDGALWALDNICLHIGSPIDDGYVEDGCVTCPFHAWRYDLATGDLITVAGPLAGLRTYPVRVSDDRVWVDVP